MTFDHSDSYWFKKQFANIQNSKHSLSSATCVQVVKLELMLELHVKMNCKKMFIFRFVLLFFSPIRSCTHTLVLKV